MILPRISPGLELVDDTGDEVVVLRVERSNAILETSDGDTYSISLAALRNALRDGDFSLLADDEMDPDLEDDEEDDGPDEED